MSAQMAHTYLLGVRMLLLRGGDGLRVGKRAHPAVNEAHGRVVVANVAQRLRAPLRERGRE